MTPPSRADVVILTRVIPHYREPLFRRLNQEFGWLVATADDPPRGDGLKPAELDPMFVRTFPFSFSDPRNPNRCRVPVRTILEATGATAVIAEFALGMTSSYELPLMRRLGGRPITVFWSHGFNMKIGIATAAGRARQLPRVWLARMADAHICYSEEGRSYLSRYIAPSRLFVAPNTIDPSPMRALARNVAPAEAPGRPHLFAVGRLTRSKDYPLLVRVTRRLRAHFPDIALTIIGSGPDEERIRVAAADDLGKRIRLIPAEYDEQALARHFLSADVCVFPGQVGLSVNHALAYSLPVVAFARTPAGPPHSPEIAYVVPGVTGALAPVYSEDCLFETLCAFLCRQPDPRNLLRQEIESYVDRRLTLDSALAGFQPLALMLAESLSRQSCRR